MQTSFRPEVMRRISALDSRMNEQDRTLTMSAFLRQLLTRGLDELDALRRPRSPH